MPEILPVYTGALVGNELSKISTMLLIQINHGLHHAGQVNIIEMYYFYKPELYKTSGGKIRNFENISQNKTQNYSLRLEQTTKTAPGGISFANLYVMKYGII